MERRVMILVASDSAAGGRREDASGRCAARVMRDNGYEVIGVKILPDDREALSSAMAAIADEGRADLILTSGGTGFSERDVTPEATEDVTERRVPGIPEAIRAYSAQFTDRAMLSRGTAGIRKKTLIINLPGSPKAVEESLAAILAPLGHGLDILAGDAGNCAR